MLSLANLFSPPSPHFPREMQSKYQNLPEFQTSLTISCSLHAESRLLPPFLDLGSC